jgi:hypothetical protein
MHLQTSAELLKDDTLRLSTILVRGAGSQATVAAEHFEKIWSHMVLHTLVALPALGLHGKQFK